MNNKKAFTLIEVILAVALLGIISIAFLPHIMNTSRWIVSTKTNITYATFNALDQMELNISNIKKELEEWDKDKDPDPLLNDGEYKYDISSKIDDIQLFSNEFKDSNRQYPEAYKVETTIDGKRKLVTLIGDTRLPPLPVPVVWAEKLSVFKENSETGLLFEYSNSEELSLKGFSLLENPNLILRGYREEWYKSKGGFLIPTPNININDVLEDIIDVDYDLGRIYPEYPNDYEATTIHEIVRNANEGYDYVNDKIIITLKSEILTKHPGRHIIFKLVPYATSLKKGKDAISYPKYIYGPSITNNLALHLDASTIDLKDIHNSSHNSNGSINEYIGNPNNLKISLRNWKSNSLNLSNINNNIGLRQTTESYMPVFKTTLLSGVVLKPEIPYQKDSEEDDGRVWGRVLGNREGSSSISNMSVDGFSLGNSWSLFTIIRRVDLPIMPQSDTNIFESIGNGRNWSLSWNSMDNFILEFKVANSSLTMPEPLNNNEWYLLGINVNGGKASMKATNLKNGINQVISIESKEDENFSPNSNNFKINWNGIELGELLIYNSELNEVDTEEVENFLVNKYNP